MVSTAGNHSIRYGARGSRTRSFWQMLRTAYTVWQERRTLTMLDDAILRDIGLSRLDADNEARRAPWDAPRRFMY